MFNDLISIKSFVILPKHLYDARSFKARAGCKLHVIELVKDYSNITIILELTTDNLIIQRHADTNKTQFFILGDCQDIDHHNPGFMGNGLLIGYDKEATNLELYTSLTGLPAAFIYHNEADTVVASDIYLLATVLKDKVHFDLDGIYELALIGHPVNHKTLFKNTSILPAGKHFCYSSSQSFDVVDTWHPSLNVHFKNWQEYIVARSDSLNSAIHRIDKSDSIFSLTAGLDSRTIFSLLTEYNYKMPVYTMSGERESLDALRAKQLCEHYGFPYTSVTIDSNFINNISEFTTEASRLSGGLESIGLALEVYYYTSLPDGLYGRVSGNLGNQVGRSGNEGTSMRNATLDVLAPDIRIGYTSELKNNWYNNIFPDENILNSLYLIQNEYLYSAVANYSIGNHFIVQQTPYADYTQITQKLHEPDYRSNKNNTLLDVKLNDLKHRFFGDSVQYSFQRKIVKDIGGYVSTCPINWGWKAQGGVTIDGIINGSMALIDTLTSSRKVQSTVINSLLKLTGIRGFSGFEEINIFESERVKEYVSDTLLSSVCLQNDVLDANKIRNIVDSDISDPRNRINIEFTMDIALAQMNFLSH